MIAEKGREGMKKKPHPILSFVFNILGKNKISIKKPHPLPTEVKDGYVNHKETSDNLVASDISCQMLL